MPAVLIAAALAVAGWLVADLRRRVPDRTPMGIALLVGGGWMPTTVAASAVGAGRRGPRDTLAPWRSGWWLWSIAGLLVLSGRPGGHALAVLLAVPAPFLAGDRPALAVGMAVAGTMTLSAAAVIRSRVVRDELEAQSVWLLAGSACLPIASAVGACSSHFTLGATTAATVAALATIAVLWASALVLDRAGSPADDGPRLDDLGLVPRLASALTLVAAPLLGPGGMALVAAALAVLTAGRRLRSATVVDGAAVRARSRARLPQPPRCGSEPPSVRRRSPCWPSGCWPRSSMPLVAVRTADDWPTPWSIPLLVRAGGRRDRCGCCWPAATGGPSGRCWW